MSTWYHLTFSSFTKLALNSWTECVPYVQRQYPFWWTSSQSGNLWMSCELQRLCVWQIWLSYCRKLVQNKYLFVDWPPCHVLNKGLFLISAPNRFSYHLWFVHKRHTNFVANWALSRAVGNRWEVRHLRLREQWGGGRQCPSLHDRYYRENNVWPAFKVFHIRSDDWNQFDNLPMRHSKKSPSKSWVVLGIIVM